MKQTLQTHRGYGGHLKEGETSPPFIGQLENPFFY